MVSGDSNEMLQHGTHVSTASQERYSPWLEGHLQRRWIGFDGSGPYSERSVDQAWGKSDHYMSTQIWDNLRRYSQDGRQVADILLVNTMTMPFQGCEREPRIDASYGFGSVEYTSD